MKQFISVRDIGDLKAAVEKAQSMDPTYVFKSEEPTALLAMYESNRQARNIK